MTEHIASDNRVRINKKIGAWAFLIRHQILLTLGFAAIIAALTVVRDMREFEVMMLEQRERVMQIDASGEVMVVGIDQPTIDALSYPIPRARQAELVDNLIAAGASRVVLDLDFSRNAQPENDTALLGAVRRHQEKVYFLQNDGQGNPDYDGKWPFKELQQAVGKNMAPMAVEFDEAGRVDTLENSWPITMKGPDEMRAPMWRLLSKNPEQRSGNFRLNSRINPASIAQLSYVDVLKNRFPASQVAGRTVYVGPTAEILQDTRPVISAVHGLIPGPVIQAMAIDTINHFPLVDQGPVVPAVLMLVIVLAGTLLKTARWRISLNLAAMGVATVAIILVEKNFGYRFDMLPTYAAATGALIAALFFAAIQQSYQAATRNQQTGIANEIAMNQRKLNKGETVVVCRIDSLIRIQRAIGLENMAPILRAIRDRITAARKYDIYQIEATHFAWVMDDDQLLPSHIEGMIGLLMGGVRYGDQSFDLEVTFGISSESAHDLASALDHAMQAADTARQKNVRWERFDPTTAIDAEWLATMLGELDRGIDRGDLSVAYQPKYDLKTQTVTGFEALVRWNHPVKGNVRPDAFIGVAEAAGRIEKLTWFVTKQAIIDLARMRKETGENLGVSINLSAKMIGDNKNITQKIAVLLEEYAVPAHAVTIELTETAVIGHIDSAMAEIRALKALGLKISIDDYGTGQSSVNYIRDLDADEIKIDQSYIRNIHSPLHYKIIESSIALARSLGKKVVAEGVEEESVMAILNDLQCDEIQGYLIGKPVAYNDLDLTQWQKTRKLSA